MTYEASRTIGGQPGNQNAWKHGRRSRQRQVAGKAATAKLKALALLGLHVNVFDDPRSVRRSPLRHDQMELLEAADPRLAQMILACGLFLPARHADVFEGPTPA
jgi:hypothetical protein